MSPPRDTPGASDEAAEEAYLRICFELAKRADRGERIDAREVLERHPEHAERLRGYLRGRRFVRAGLDGAAAPAPPAVEADGGGGALRELLERLWRERPAGDRYRAGAELGKGGWGVVLEGEDPRLGRSVAVKRLTGPVLDWAGEVPVVRRPRALARFLEEAQITSQLDHPGIVPVHELGLDADGAPYFAMKLVKGHPLNEAIEALHAGRPPRADPRFRTEVDARGGPRPWTLERVLDALERVAEALAYAHHKGVVHRDLKPHNVIVGRFGEVFLLDWGLARVVAEAPGSVALTEGWRTAVPRTVRSEGEPGADPLATESGEVLGTPCYLPPDAQVVGRAGDAGAPASFALDVYGLGALLYHALAGHAPYAGPGRRQRPAEVQARIVAGPPDDLRRAAPGAPPALVALCERSMAREPAGRPPSAEAWLEELRGARGRAPTGPPAEPGSRAVERTGAAEHTGAVEPSGAFGRPPAPAGAPPGPSRAALAWLPWALLAFALGLWLGRLSQGT